MRVGGEYLVRRVNRSSWEKLAAACHLPSDYVLSRIQHLVEQLPAAAHRVRVRSIGEGLDSDIIETLTERIEARAEKIRAW